jgi:ferredoxin-NADP reductase/DMSO/TMAO reductase YedYZ heme-binding membrane subunit
MSKLCGAWRLWAGTFSVAAMLILVALMAHGHHRPVSRIELDPAVWWYVARASGLLAGALLSASMMGGLLLSTRLTRGHTRTWTQQLHQFIAAFAVVFIVIHLVSVLAVDELRINLRELLVPFARSANPVAQGCGVIAFYLLLIVVLTSWARALLPWQRWRHLHLLTFPLFVLACTHTALAGSDITQPIVHWTSAVVGVAILLLAIVRLRTARGSSAAAAAPISTGPVATAASLDPPQPTTRTPTATAAPTTAGTEMRLLIIQTTWEADNVLSLRLRRPEGTALPSWEPGAHIELPLPSGRCRQYSLCGDPNDTGSYRIAILQVAEGRGGSVEVHTRARAGQLLTVQGPRNHFPLVPSPAYLFIAGGIGITAVLAMTARVAATGAQWELVYTGRRCTGMAFIEEVLALNPERVDIVPTHERGRPNLGKIIGAAAPGTAVYCCGPDRLLREVRERVAARPDLSLHSERFTGTPTTGGAGFYVELRRTGRTIKVPPNRTVLQAVRDVVPAVSAGCEQGTCGMCRTTVLAGEPDHRDSLLTSAEHAAGQMLICVSRARNERLVLDL